MSKDNENVKDKTVNEPTINMPDTPIMREAFQDMANTSLYQEVSGLFWSGVFGKLVEYGNAPTLDDLETALALIISPDEFVRPYSERPDQEPGAAQSSAYVSDDRQVLSEAQYESLLENGNRVLKAIEVGEALEAVGFTPEKAPEEVYNEVLESWKSRQQFRRDKEEFTHARRAERMANAKEAIKSRLTRH